MKASQSAILGSVLGFALFGSHAARGDDYWTYAYQEFEVVTPGGAARAESLAHHLVRFDTAITKILSLPTSRVPTVIYELSASQEKKLVGESGVSSFSFNGYEVSVIAADESPGEPNPYWGALFGYTGSLLMIGPSSRYPYWIHLGVPQLFAHTDFNSDKITTGGLVASYAQFVKHGRLMPMRTFLNIQAGDARLTQSDFVGQFEAQSWYLAREIYVERKFSAEFAKYLALVVDGKTPAEAFPASFSMTYEDLDVALAKGMNEPQHMYVLQVPQERAGVDTATKLTAPEFSARIALLAIARHRWDYAHQLAAEALAIDPTSEGALRAMALANLHDRNSEAALDAINKLAARPALSAAALTDMGYVLFNLSGMASAGSTGPSLAARAGVAYEQATRVDPEYLRAWADLAHMVGSQHDTEAAKALVKRAGPVLEQHYRNGALARALATLCAESQQSDCAFLYGEYWRQDAITFDDRDAAVAFMARLNPLGKPVGKTN